MDDSYVALGWPGARAASRAAVIANRVLGLGAMIASGRITPPGTVGCHLSVIALPNCLKQRS
jgi:hypothetical protein